MLDKRTKAIGKNVSILILTLNEEENIEACLKAVSWSNDVVVLDSGSRDRTAQRARKLGARVVVRAHQEEVEVG